MHDGAASLEPEPWMQHAASSRPQTREHDSRGHPSARRNAEQRRAAVKPPRAMQARWRKLAWIYGFVP